MSFVKYATLIFFLLLGLQWDYQVKKEGFSHDDQTKNHFLRFLLSHTSVYLKDQELLLSDDEKLDLFKQIVRSIKQVLATDHVKEEGL